MAQIKSSAGFSAPGYTRRSVDAALTGLCHIKKLYNISSRNSPEGAA